MENGSHFENWRKKSRYLKNRLTNFSAIWNDDAYWSSERYGPEKKRDLKSKMVDRYDFDIENRQLPFKFPENIDK